MIALLLSLSLLVLVIFAYFRDKSERKFKAQFLPMIQEFHREFPDFALRAAGRELLLLKRNEPHTAFIMWNSYRLNEPASRLPHDIDLAGFQEQVIWLHKKTAAMRKYAIAFIMSEKQRTGLIAAIEKYELESSYEYQKAQRQLAM